MLTNTSSKKSIHSQSIDCFRLATKTSLDAQTARVHCDH